jgi:hypothetical protein
MAQSDTPRLARLSWRDRRFMLVIALPAGGISFAYTIVTTYVPVLIHDLSGPVVTGMLIGAEGLVALIVPVLLGGWSDRLRTRWGGRLPLVFAGSVLVAVTLVLLPTGAGSLTAITMALLGFFAALVLATAFALLFAEHSSRLSATLRRLQDTTAQIRVRGAFLLLIGFVALAERLGLEVILGAFLAGAILAHFPKAYSVTVRVRKPSGPVPAVIDHVSATVTVARKRDGSERLKILGGLPSRGQPLVCVLERHRARAEVGLEAAVVSRAGVHEPPIPLGEPDTAHRTVRGGADIDGRGDVTLPDLVDGDAGDQVIERIRSRDTSLDHRAGEHRGRIAQRDIRRWSGSARAGKSGGRARHHDHRDQGGQVDDHDQGVGHDQPGGPGLRDDQPEHPDQREQQHGPEQQQAGQRGQREPRQPIQRRQQSRAPDGRIVRGGGHQVGSRRHGSNVKHACHQCQTTFTCRNSRSHCLDSGP